MTAGLLDGKAVIVTGAGGGLGRSYALASAAAGARVLANDIDATAAWRTAEAIRAAGGTAEPHVGDVGDPSVARDLVAEALARFGALDGLVNNAGLLSPGPVVGQSAAVVSRTLATNVEGPWHCSVAAIEVMRQGGRGSIVNVVSGAMQGLPGLALYGTSKAAVLGMTYGLALELDGTGVRVNAVSPLARTAMSDLMDVDDSHKGGSPDLVAPAVVYLLSDRSDALHGQVVRFDGRSLGLVTSPRLAAASGTRAWTAEAIAEAIEGRLGDFIQPVGLAAASAAARVEG